ncbi:MAG: phage head-tail connector protein [Ruminiclostridium sp.]
MEALEMLKIRLGVSDNTRDGLLSLLLSEAQDTILDIIGREELPARLISVQVELAVIAYNKQGAEGESSRSEGGISRSFVDGLPDDLKQRLRNYPRKVGVIRAADDG